MTKPKYSKKLLPLIEEWTDCTRCSLHQHATEKVFHRGRCPCDLLFIGEAPGSDEDLLGVPFIGRSGQLLDHLLAETIPKRLRVAITNVVCCKPPHVFKKQTPPKPIHVTSCRPRLVQYLQIVKPKLIITVGKVAHSKTGWMEKKPYLYERTNILHPAYMLRNGGHNSQPYRQAKLTLQNMIKEYDAL